MKIASYTTYIESDYGTSILHNVIACNLFAKLRTHLKVEIYRPHGDICWGIITDEPGDTVEIASLEIKLGMDEIYFESGIAC